MKSEVSGGSNRRLYKLNVHLCSLAMALLSIPLVQGQVAYNYDSLFQTVASLENDSLKTDAIRNKAMTYRTSNPGLGIAIYKKLFDAPFYFVSDNNPKYDDYMLGELHLHANNFNESESYLIGYYDFWKTRENNANDLTAAKLKLSDLYLTKGEYEKSIKASLEVETIAAEADMPVMLIRAGTNTAAVMNKAGRKIEALEKLQDLVPVAEQYPIALSQVYNGLSVIYEEHGPLDSALLYMYKFKDLVFQAPNYPNQFIAIYNIATTEEKRGNLDKALKSIIESEEIAIKSGVPIFKSYAAITKAGILLQKNELAEAERILNQASEYELLPDQQSLLIKGYYQLHQKKGQFSKALSYHEQWKELEDSLRSEEIATSANELEIRFEAVRKEAQISQLESDKALQKQQIRTQWLGIVGLSALLMTLGIFFYVINRQRNRIKAQNDTISKALKDKEVLLKEIHHRVKNNLQIVSSLLSLQSRSVNDEKATSALEDGQNRVQSMALIHQHLYTGENITGVKVKKYLMDLCKNVFLSHQVNSDEIKLELDIQDIELDISTIVPLGLVLNELITNSCKYAFPDGGKGNIKVHLIEEDDVLKVMVSDDGVGFENDVASGFGSKLIRSFARKMDADVIRDSEHGASTLLLIKNYKKIIS